MDGTTPHNSRAQLRHALGAFPTGVTVVTVGGDQPHGMTANSFTSVSLDPPLVLVCIEQTGLMCTSLVQQGKFALSVLSARQEVAARHFASRSRPPGNDQFAAVEWTTGTFSGAPLIAGAAAHFECELWRAYDGGDHLIVVGQLMTVSRNSRVAALLFHNGVFTSIEEAWRVQTAA